jgi:hypothetical protein
MASVLEQLKMPRIVSPEELAPGDVLAADVSDRSGRLILGRGRAVSERNIETLRAWGIQRIELLDDGELLAPSDGPVALSAAREAVLPRFAQVPHEHPFIAALIEVCAQQHLADAPAGGRQ